MDSFLDGLGEDDGQPASKKQRTAVSATDDNDPFAPHPAGASAMPNLDPLLDLSPRDPAPGNPSPPAGGGFLDDFFESIGDDQPASPLAPAVSVRTRLGLCFAPSHKGYRCVRLADGAAA